VAARVAALGCVFAATLILAHHGGPAVVGVYALLHVLPGLVGTVISSGLPVATPYFLSGADRHDRRLPWTLTALALGGGMIGTTVWVLATPVLAPLLFSGLPVPLVALAGLLVLTRLIVITAKACSQGSDDLAGSNAVIFVEQFNFVVTYTLLWVIGIHGFATVIGGLLLADCMTGALAWARLVRKGFYRGATRPSLALARRIAGYGLRGQLGGVMSQLNLRLDFVLLPLFTGPAVLGVYAVASKFAELPRILGMALTYVFYPKFAQAGRSSAMHTARKLIPQVAMLTAGALIPLWLTAAWVIPTFYGSRFDTAVTPTRIILVGLALDGVAGMISGLLYGAGRPGLNSWAMAAGLTVTVALDLLLIPSYGITGAALASAFAYTTTGVALIFFYTRLQRRDRGIALRVTGRLRRTIATAQAERTNG
jgi:O-antigen/teichoic acid export membrane protein